MARFRTTEGEKGSLDGQFEETGSPDPATTSRSWTPSHRISRAAAAIPISNINEGSCQASLPDYWPSKMQNRTSQGHQKAEACRVSWDTMTEDAFGEAGICMRQLSERWKFSVQSRTSSVVYGIRDWITLRSPPLAGSSDMSAWQIFDDLVEAPHNTGKKHQGNVNLKDQHQSFYNVPSETTR